MLIHVEAAALARNEVPLGDQLVHGVQHRVAPDAKLAGERADKRVAHWQGVAASACEQCGRNQVPAVAAPRAIAGPATSRR